MRSVFVVLSDDMFRQVVSKLNKFKKRSTAAQSGESSATTETSEATGSNAVAVSPSGPFKTVFTSRSKSNKRGASSQGGPSAKK